MSIRAQLQAAIDRLLAGRSPRDRQILTWGAAVCLLLILIVGIWMPLQQAQSRLERSVAVERKRLAVMGAARLELAAMENRSGQQSRPALSRPAIEELARARLVPATLDVRLEGEHGVKIAFSGAQLPRVVEWIDELSRSQRIHVTSARLRAEGATITGEVQLAGAEP
ncbi:MAG: type II secretion system protein GspM [Betaproteobacteria bacterium]|nr:type II secretion system protein GspM [Rhodocyclales bacterium]